MVFYTIYLWSLYNLNEDLFVHLIIQFLHLYNGEEGHYGHLILYEMLFVFLVLGLKLWLLENLLLASLVSMGSIIALIL